MFVAKETADKPVFLQTSIAESKIAALETINGILALTHFKAILLEILPEISKKNFAKINFFL